MAFKPFQPKANGKSKSKGKPAIDAKSKGAIGKPSGKVNAKFKKQIKGKD